MSLTLERLLTTDEVANILGVAPKQVRNLPIRFVLVGVRKRRYEEIDVRKYIADQKKEGSECRSTSVRARRTTTRNSKSTILGYAEARRQQPVERP
jgi:hypothetical protein